MLLPGGNRFARLPCPGSKKNEKIQKKVHECESASDLKRILITNAVQIIFNSRLLLILVKFFRMRHTADLCNFYFINNGSYRLTPFLLGIFFLW